MHRRLLFLALLLLTTIGSASAGEVTVAVSSNFAVARSLASWLEQTSGHRIALVFGSTGKHYAQILNGAPFDVFLAADEEHPARLEESGHAVPGSRFTYAVGNLLLWSPDYSVIDARAEVLQHGSFRYLAIANPELAPYGAAARQVLIGMALWDSLQDRLVRGENVAQAYQFVASGNAELGFVARSQLERNGQLPTTGSYWKVPSSLHEPLRQQAVLLVDSGPARAFLDFLRSDNAREIIRKSGYTVPD